RLTVHFADALRSDQSRKQQRMRTIHPPVIYDLRFRSKGLHETDHTGENRVGNWAQHRPRNERNWGSRESSLEQRGSIPWREDCHAIASLDELPGQGP